MSFSNITSNFHYLLLSRHVPVFSYGIANQHLFPQKGQSQLITLQCESVKYVKHIPKRGQTEKLILTLFYLQNSSDFSISLYVQAQGQASR